MNSVKDTIEGLKNLEAEKLRLIAEVEELKKIAEARSNVLVNEIADLREQANSLKTLTQPEKPGAPSKDFIKEKNLTAEKELAEKIIDASQNLGKQIFANSPFSKDFDNWLDNLRQIVSDFETNSPIFVDEQFIKDRSQILLDVEGALARQKVEESKVDAIALALADNNHLLAEADKEYAEKAKELSHKKASEFTQLSNRVHELERQVQKEEEENRKRRILKKKTMDEIPRKIQELKSARTELEDARRNFVAEEDKLREGYEKKKQEIREQVERLRKELATLETDTSIETRQAASKALANAVSAQVQRITSVP